MRGTNADWGWRRSTWKMGQRCVRGGEKIGHHLASRPRLGAYRVPTHIHSFLIKHLHQFIFFRLLGTTGLRALYDVVGTTLSPRGPLAMLRCLTNGFEAVRAVQEIPWERDKKKEQGRKIEHTDGETSPRPPLESTTSPWGRPPPPLESGCPSLCCDFRRFKGGGGGRFPVRMLDFSTLFYRCSMCSPIAWCGCATRGTNGRPNPCHTEDAPCVQ